MTALTRLKLYGDGKSDNIAASTRSINKNNNNNDKKQ